MRQNEQFRRVRALDLFAVNGRRTGHVRPRETRNFSHALMGVCQRMYECMNRAKNQTFLEKKSERRPKDEWGTSGTRISAGDVVNSILFASKKNEPRLVPAGRKDQEVRQSVGMFLCRLLGSKPGVAERSGDCL